MLRRILIFSRAKNVSGSTVKLCKQLNSTSSEIGDNVQEAEKKESKRMSEFRKKLRESTPIDDPGDQPLMHPSQIDEALAPWPENTNPHTGEIGGPKGPEPTRFGDWERKGRVTDF